MGAGIEMERGRGREREEELGLQKIRDLGGLRNREVWGCRVETRRVWGKGVEFDGEMGIKRETREWKWRKRIRKRDKKLLRQDA